MVISGFIATNMEPEFCDLEKLCNSKGIVIETENHCTINGYALSIKHNQLTINLHITHLGVKYKTKMPELWGYTFISVVIVFLLFKLMTLGLWVMLLFFMPLILISIKIAYDKHIHKIVDSVIPESLKFLPEKATKEQTEWLKDPNVCPACGTERNPYSDKCHSCGLSFGAIKKLTDNQSQTVSKNIKIVYNNEK